MHLDDCVYSTIEVDDISTLRSIAEEERFDGFNVTSPHKQNVIAMLDKIDSVASATGSVNVIKVEHRNSRLWLDGFNSDATAFLETLQTMHLPAHGKALILGTGGAAQSVAWALRQFGWEHTFVSRKRQDNQKYGIPSDRTTWSARSLRKSVWTLPTTK